MATPSNTTGSSHLPPTLAFLIANFPSFISVKLDNSNYFTWKTQVENALKANSLFEYADGSLGIPPSYVVDTSGNKNPNPTFEQWQIVDRMLFSCLIATLSPSVLPHIVGSTYLFQLWNKLEEKFNVLSRSHVHDLKRKLYSLNKTGTMEQYLDFIKEIVQKLAASGSYVDDEELVFHTLNGLKTGFKSLKQTVRSRPESFTFSSLTSLLMAEDLHMVSCSFASTCSHYRLQMDFQD